MNDDIKITILSLISESGARWNWYKLDRALSARGLGGRCNVAQAANSLANAGLLELVTGDIPAMPTYVITEKGKKLLESQA